MNCRVSILLVCVLIPGCGFHHRLPMYSDYNRVELGVPPPDDIQGNPQWGTKQLTEWRWSTGIEEEARYLVGADGEVIAKWYRGMGEEGSLPILWYKSRHRSEGEVLVPTNQMSSDADILAAIRNRYVKIWNDFTEQSVHELFRLAEEEGGLTREKFGVWNKKLESLFPSVERTVWQLRRTESEAFHILVEEKKDISLVVWAFFGWMELLHGESPH